MRFCLVLLALVLSSCSIIPTKRSQSQAIKGAEALAGTNSLSVRKFIEGEKSQPLPPVTVSGTSNTVVVSTAPAFAAAVPSPRGTFSAPAPSRDVPNAARVPYREETVVESNSGQSATSTQDVKAKSLVSIPLGVSLALAGLGLLIVVFAVRYALRAARQGSAAVAVALDTADGAMAKIIRDCKAKAEALQHHAAASTEPRDVISSQQQIAALQAQVATLEAERGKLANSKP